MKKKILILMIGFLLIGVNLYAAGDLIVEGKIGIGTTSPGQLLHISGAKNVTNNVGIRFERQDNTKFLFFDWVPEGSRTPENVAWGMGLRANSNHFQYWTWDGSVETIPLTITNTGNVGIGTTDPQAKLDVAGDAIFSKNVGIGTTSPNAELDVIGTARIDFVPPSIGVPPAPFYPILTISKNGNEFVRFTYDGNVGIGTPNPSFKLHVNGSIGTTNEGQVHSDYVFEPDYPLMSLEELSAYIEQEKHLPGIVTDPAKVVNIDLLAFNGKLLEKIEELTLYVIEQNKKIEDLEKRLEEVAGNLTGQ